MSIDTEMTGRVRRRIPLWAKIVIGVVLVLAALIAFPHIYFGLKIRTEMNRIKAEGAPTTLAECDALYPMPPMGENAADVLVPAFAAMTQPSNSDELPLIGKAELPPRSQPMPEAMTQSVAAYLEANAKTLESLRKGATMNECRYPVNLLMGPGTLLDHLASLRQACRLFSLESLVRAEERDAAGAADSITSALGVAHSLAAEPILISQLVRIACDSICIGGLQRVLSLQALSEPGLRAVDASLQAEEQMMDVAFVHALEFERCSMSSVFQQPGAVGGFVGGSYSPLNPLALFYRVTGALAADHFAYLQTMRETIAAFREPLPARLRAVDKVNVQAERRWRGRRLSGMLIGAYDRVCWEEAKSIALLRCARTALAVERYRLAHAALPESLDQLAPNFIDTAPSDPFDGKLLRYRKLAKGYVVYSIGTNLKDDSGAEQKPNTASESDYDVTFTVER